MKMNVTSYVRAGRPVCVYLPETSDGPLRTVYMLAGPEPRLELTGALDKAAALLGPFPFAAVAVGTDRWNHDYSPWPAPAMMDGEPPFTGGAGETISWLTTDLIPSIEAREQILPQPGGRIILGYSLAGLCALYAMYQTDFFSACGCCSGSLWFDGWLEYTATHRVRPGSRIYISIGRDEEKAKNPRIAVVGAATRAIGERYSNASEVADTALVFHDGSHFSHIPDRVGAAIYWLFNAC